MVEASALKKAGIFKDVLRSKGFVWIATRPRVKGSYAQAGANVQVDPACYWKAVVWPFEEVA